MEGNKMSTEEVEEETHEEGPRWTVSGRFATFDEADNKRATLRKEDASLQVKIHYQGSATNRYFAVKSRIDPEIVALMEQMNKPKKKKKKR
jgi:hypothetical protein